MYLQRSRVAFLAGLGLLVSACAAPAGSATSGVHLTLVAYSTPQEAYARLVPAFQETAPGAAISVDSSFGASGSQTQAVSNGLAADVVALSLASDMTKLVGAIVLAGYGAQLKAGNHLDGTFVRPHDVRIHPVWTGRPTGAREALVERLTHLGFEVRVELALTDGGGRLWSQITRDDLARLGMELHQRVYVESVHVRTFGGPQPTVEDATLAATVARR